VVSDLSANDFNKGSKKDTYSQECQRTTKDFNCARQECCTVAVAMEGVDTPPIKGSKKGTNITRHRPLGCWLL
jgi:hypothetical protein